MAIPLHPAARAGEGTPASVGNIGRGGCRRRDVGEPGATGGKFFGKWGLSAPKLVPVCTLHDIREVVIDRFRRCG
jgi:hypothetical protein